MSSTAISRRNFVVAGTAFCGLGLSCANGLSGHLLGSALAPAEQAADYTLHIKASPIEIAPKHIIAATTYNGTFPGPLLP